MSSNFVEIVMLNILYIEDLNGNCKMIRPIAVPPEHKKPNHLIGLYVLMVKKLIYVHYRSKYEGNLCS